MPLTDSDRNNNNADKNVNLDIAALRIDQPPGNEPLSSKMPHPSDFPNETLHRIANPVKERLLAAAREIVVLPKVAIEAIAIADDPDANVDNLVNVIVQDMKLTTDIVALANSAAFGSRTRIIDIKQAITRMGLKRCKNLIYGACITSMMSKMHWEEESTRDHLSRHGMLTAILNSKLNRLFNLGLWDQEFTAGLIHDVGRALLAVSLPDQFRQCDPIYVGQDCDYLKRENELLGTNHMEVGAWFLERNHLPDELAYVARFHHDPGESKKFKKLVAVTSAASEMATCVQSSLPIEEFVPNTDLHVDVLERLGTQFARKKFEKLAPSLMLAAADEMQQMAGMM